MDTESPTKTNWWWGEVNTNVARLYIQTSDNASGINRVQCPTSTASGGYNNWVWFSTVWDSSANAWRADITPATFGHYGQTYVTHLYIYDNAGNGGYVDATSAAIGSIEPVNLWSSLTWTGTAGTESGYAQQDKTYWVSGNWMCAEWGTSWANLQSSSTNLSQYKNVALKFCFMTWNNYEQGYFRIKVIDASSGAVLATSNNWNGTYVSSSSSWSYDGSYTFTPTSSWTNCYILLELKMTCSGGDHYWSKVRLDSVTGNYN